MDLNVVWQERLWLLEQKAKLDKPIFALEAVSVETSRTFSHSRG